MISEGKPFWFEYIGLDDHPCWVSGLYSGPIPTINEYNMGLSKKLGENRQIHLHPTSQSMSIPMRLSHQKSWCLALYPNVAENDATSIHIAHPHVLQQLLISLPEQLGMSREDLLQLSPGPCTLSKQVHLPRFTGKQLGTWGKRGNLMKSLCDGEG